MASVFNTLDTNAVLRIFLDDGKGVSGKVEKLLSRWQTKFVVPDVVLFELAYVLAGKYHFSRSDIRDFISRLMSIDKLLIDEKIFVPTLEAFVKFPKLSFADCYLAEYAKNKQCGPLWTFDRKLALQSEIAQEIE